MEAINFARDQKIDVVLVDTAGRMQDNEPLMRALAKVKRSSERIPFGYCHIYVGSGNTGRSRFT
jgi:signal recognition particle GTPase